MNLPENKFMYKNIERKQKMIDDKQKLLQEKKEHKVEKIKKKKLLLNGSGGLADINDAEGIPNDINVET